MPPKKGYMCERYATLLKANFVMEGQKKYTDGTKEKGIEEAAKNAEEVALKYLHSGSCGSRLRHTGGQRLRCRRWAESGNRHGGTRL